MIKKRIENKKLIALIFISIILFSGYAPFLTQYLNTSSTSETESNNGAKSSFLYLNNVTNADYTFDAKGECFILVEIEDIDFTEFELDGQKYTVSYGLNIIPIKFGQSYESHQILIDPLHLEFFKTFTVEPLIIAEGSLTTRLDQDSEINFQAGGMISILTRPSFLYNWLYVELKDKYDNSTVLKRIHDPTEYPEIDPLFYCLFIERGTFIRYDIDVDPGEYKLILRGNGTLEYKIIVNSDWDRDDLNDVDEIQQEGFYEFDLDPTVPDLWGFFEKSDENLLFTRIEENEYTPGYFSFYVPETHAGNELVIRVNSGEFKNMVVDLDSKFFEDEVFISDRYSPPDREMYGEISKGWHHISYNHKVNFTSDIEFLIGTEKIKVLKFPEVIDTDGDGVKDLEEFTNGLNPAKLDTDEDGIPDNLDTSPIAKLYLNPNKINQIVVPTDKGKNSIINIQIKKPNNDYSTNGIPRLWRNAFNVSIYPVLRMFGNKVQKEDNTKDNMNRQKLIETWGKNVTLIYESYAGFDQTRVGDPLPNPTDPDTEFYLVFPKPSETSIEYDIRIPKNHPSKNDNYLDLRFDFIWLVTKYDSETGNTSILHFYDFQENILIQSMSMREISNVEYILGKPDNFIENQILWTLTQNPSLGTPVEFGVEDDIIGKGNVDFFNLPDQTLKDRKNKNLGINETEVLYMGGLYQNYDILNKINLKSIVNPDFATLYQGDFEACFTSYTISNLYKGQDYFLGDSEITGETKLLYQIHYDNFSTIGAKNVQKRANILGMPINMELLANSKVLKISRAQGSGIPLNEIPYSLNSQLNDKITIWHQTYIERGGQSQGVPLINFQNGVDICKDFFDNRQHEVQSSELFFTSEPSQIPAELLKKLINEFWNRLGLINESFSSLGEFVSTAPDLPDERLDLQMIGHLINKINTFSDYSYSKLSDFTDFFQFILELHQDSFNLLDMYLDLDSDYNIPEDWSPSELVIVFIEVAETVADVADQFASKFCDKISEIAKEVRLSDAEVPKQNVAEEQSTSNVNSEMKINQVKMGAMGAVMAVLGIILIGFAIYEIYQLASDNADGEYDGNQVEFALRMTGAVCSLTLGAITLTVGVLHIITAFKPALVQSLQGALKILGGIAIALAIVILVFEWVTFFTTTDYGSTFAVDLTKLIVNTAVVLIGLTIALACSSTGVGIVVGVIVFVLCFLTSWLTPLLNHPSINILDTTTLYLPDDTKTNIRRHGGLEVGDTVCFRLNIHNDGDRPVWMRARFKVYGVGWTGTYSYTYDDDGLFGSPGTCFGQYGWKGRWGTGGYVYWNYDPYFNEWKKYGGYYDDGQYYDEKFASEITGASPNIYSHLEFEMDWERIDVIIFVPIYTRVTGTRKTGSDAIINSLDMPALENSISKFYASTTEYFSISSVMEKFYTAREEYRYKDAYAAVNEIQQIQEKKCGISLSYFNSLKQKLQAYPADSTYYSVKISNIWKALGLLIYHYNDGFKYLSFSDGFFIILIPKAWITYVESEFAIVNEVKQLGNTLPLITNIKTDLRGEPIEMDGISGITDVDLKLYLEGSTSDKQKIVKFTINAPDEFYITPQNDFICPLSSTLHFTIVRNTTEFLIGVHYLSLKIYLGSQIIYEEIIPFWVKGFSLVELETHTAAESIVPGDLFYAVDVINSGTFIEVIEFSVEGIPESFIYKGLYPNDFISGNTQKFYLYPGESRTAFIIQPPRHYTTSPDLYSYQICALDPVYNNFNLTFNDQFEVAEFYDMDFQCINPEMTIFDYQTGTYTFELTNLGNVPQEFQISFDDIPFADEFLSEDVIYQAPGGVNTTTLTITPTGWGEQEFAFNATSVYNSSTIIGKITINDDDVNPPEFSGFEIIDTPIDVTVKFNVSNEMEGDDCGLSNIKIFIDNELMLNYTPDSTETSFSFTFDDTYRKWFIEYGTHEIRVEIIDNDFDVVNDALNSSISGTFETTLEDMCEYVNWEIGNLNQKIQETSDDVWGCPAANSKKVMESKLDEVKKMISCHDFEGAYNKFLHDVKPKLTGLKTDEKEEPWGNGVFKNPWVTDAGMNEEFRTDCNEILSDIKTLINTPA